MLHGYTWNGALIEMLVLLSHAVEWSVLLGLTGVLTLPGLTGLFRGQPWTSEMRALTF